MDRPGGLIARALRLFDLPIDERRGLGRISFSVPALLDHVSSQSPCVFSPLDSNPCLRQRCVPWVGDYVAWLLGGHRATLPPLTGRLSGEIDTTTVEGRAMFGMLSVLAELQRELIIANTRDGLNAARARGRMSFTSTICSTSLRPEPHTASWMRGSAPTATATPARCAAPAAPAGP